MKLDIILTELEQFVKKGEKGFTIILIVLMSILSFLVATILCEVNKKEPLEIESPAIIYEIGEFL